MKKEEKFITTNTVTITTDDMMRYEMEAATINCKVALTRWIYCFGNKRNPYEVREENSKMSWDEMAKHNSNTNPYVR